MSRIPGYQGPVQTNPPDGEASIVIYNYIPSLALGIVGATTFGLLTLIHSFYCIRGKGTRLYQFLLAFGCAMEVVGYAFRIQSSENPFRLVPFIVQYFMIVVAPVLWTTAVYLSLWYAARKLAGGDDSNTILPIKPRLVILIFAPIDVVCTILQVAGAALIGTTNSDRAEGTLDPNGLQPEDATNILLAGLAAQVFSFLCFLTLLAIAVKRWPKSAGRFYPVTLTGASILLLLRFVYRLAETGQGTFGEAYSNEVYFACLEYVPVVLAIAILAIKPLYKQIKTTPHGETYKA